MIVPLVVRERVLGAITLISAESGRMFGDDDLALAEEVARRASVAIDNARLYRNSRKQAAEHEAILSQMADGLVLSDMAGRVVYMNEAAERVLGISNSEETARRLEDVLRDRDELTVRPSLDPVLQSDDVAGFEKEIVRSDGSHLILHVTSAPIRGDDGESTGTIAVFRDVTAQRELERQKDVFLSSAAHNLRTPLTTIKGRAQMLAKKLSSIDGLETGLILSDLDRINANTGRMMALVDELLDATRIQMGEPLILNLVPVDLVHLVHQVVADQPRLPDRTRIRVVDQADSVIATVDKDRIERIIGNLLSNATKYSPNGQEVVVRIEQCIKGEEPWAVLSFVDRGIGIPEIDLPLIFKRFFRGSNATGRVPGTGLGLAGAQSIAQQHGGHLEVHSEEGLGSTFHLFLPLHGVPPTER